MTRYTSRPDTDAPLPPGVVRLTIDGKREVLFDYFGCDGTTPSERLAELRAQYNVPTPRLGFDAFEKLYKESRHVDRK